MAKLHDLLIFIPTYNEAENAPALFERILEQQLPADVLFVDDSSIDGTGELLDDLAAIHPNLTVVHRLGKQGVGSAHALAIRRAYADGYKILVTMDCDFTHPPEKIPEILAAAATGNYDIVVGSRYIDPDSLHGWNPFRRVLTHSGHALTNGLLGMPYDATGAFRCYLLERLPVGAFDLVTSSGYAFFLESLNILFRNGIRIGEIPIRLPKRTYGHSKMVFAEAWSSLLVVLAIKFKLIFNPEKFQVVEELAPGAIDHTKRDTQGWDAYWDSTKDSPGGLLYDAIASIYRKWIIRPTLNAFVSEYFAPGSSVLHAGCGSGQVDVDIRHIVRITGLDISVNALSLYRRTNGNLCEVLHGSVFDIPLGDETMDGIYNLGVMEHFTEAEIGEILAQFHRVLRADGRLILFWPPEFGLSVIFFKALRRLYALLGGGERQFHPLEITRVTSRRHATALMAANGFSVLRYAFGPRDAYTYAVIVASKTGRESSAIDDANLREGDDESAASV
jgi:dolichol-phosphate mannosyltransferase